MLAGTVRTPPRWLLPVATGVAGLATIGLVASVDPHEQGHYPTCPFLALTGLYCPGCGTLRAVHALFHGDLVGALDLNVLTVLLLPLLAWAWVGWLSAALGRRVAVPQLPPRAAWAVAVLIPLFWVARNLPGFESLAPSVPA